jgi:hypothetical protein
MLNRKGGEWKFFRQRVRARCAIYEVHVPSVAKTFESDNASSVQRANHREGLARFGSTSEVASGRIKDRSIFPCGSLVKS